MTSAEKRTVICNGHTITYNLIRKNVKNINLRILINGEIKVSSNYHIPGKLIDEFVLSKSRYILSAIQKNKMKIQNPANVPTQPECLLIEISKDVFNLLKLNKIHYPEIKIRKMKASWGICRPRQGVVTFNKKLLEAPRESIEYVVLHEFAHLVYPDHSKKFYDFIAAHMPDWKQRAEVLRWIL